MIFRHAAIDSSVYFETNQNAETWNVQSHLAMCLNKIGSLGGPYTPSISLPLMVMLSALFYSAQLKDCKNTLFSHYLQMYFIIYHIW